MEYDGVQIHIVVPDDKTYPRDILTFGWKNSKELLDYLAKSVPGSLSEAKKVFPSIEFPPHMTFIAVPSTFRKTPLQGPGTVASSMGNRTFLNVGTIIAGRLFGNPDVSPDLNTWVSEEAFHHGSFKQTLSPTEVFSTYLSARITPLPAFPRLKNRDIAPRLLRYLAQNYSDDEGLQEYIHWFNQENHLDPLAEFTLMPFPANYGPEEKSEANLRKFMRSEEVTKAFRVALNEVNNDLAKHHAVWWITGLQLPVYKAIHQAFNQTSQRRRHL